MQISIVINTLNRANSLSDTLDSLTRLILKPNLTFEVIVVNGPSTDNTEEVLKVWEYKIKIKKCNIANLSVSRNIGIAAARGDIVAFLDDDSLPEANWLVELEKAYSDKLVAAAGGPVFDHNGFQYQTKYEVVNRFGDTQNLGYPTPHLCIPNSNKIPSLLGANSSFRLDVLKKLGGFDEVIEYFLDETDVLFRIVDNGYIIRQLPNSFVHHKSRPSGLRNEKKVPVNRFPIIKNKIHFIRKHCVDAPNALKLFNIEKFINKHEGEAQWALENEFISRDEYNDFKFNQLPQAKEIGFATKTGLYHHFDCDMDLDEYDKYLKFTTKDFSFLTLRVILVSRGFPNSNNGGIAKFVKSLANSMKDHVHVHVITETMKDVEYIDYSDGVWIHNIKSTDVLTESDVYNKADLPQDLNNWSYSALKEVLRIKERMSVDIIEAPIWDAEGIAFVLNKPLLGNTKVVTSLHTMLKHYVNSNTSLLEDNEWVESHFNKVVDGEITQIVKSDGIRANTEAVVKSIEAEYKINIKRDCLRVINHGVPELASKSINKFDSLNECNFLFVGRLEKRKGIDILLEAIEIFYESYDINNGIVRFRLVGLDKGCFLDPTFRSFKEYFTNKHNSKSWIGYVEFLGEISDIELYDEYAKCSVFVAPSRFESFGLIFLEAMSCSKPVIGTNIGGIPEVVQDKVNGLLVGVENPYDLSIAFTKLLDNKLRTEFGKYSRLIYETKFTPKIMSDKSIEFYSKICNSSVLKIVIVHSILAKYDGISNIILDHIDYLKKYNSKVSITFVGYRCDYDEIDHVIVNGREGFLESTAIREANIILFHFGVYYELFECIKDLSTTKNTYVVFHNITPARFLSQSSKELTDKSFGQIPNCRYADKVFCISNENIKVLRSYGIYNYSKIPIGSTTNPTQYLSLLKEYCSNKKDRGRINIAFIGRIVKSKGAVDLLNALVLLLKNDIDLNLKIKLVVITNLEFSDKEYLDSFSNLLDQMKDLSCFDFEIASGVSDKEKADILSGSDMFVLPSYHEGYGIPILEALSHGCHIVAYDNSNISFLLSEIGTLVETGNVKSLTSALQKKCIEILDDRNRRSFNEDYIKKCYIKLNSIFNSENIHFFDCIVDEFTKYDQSFPTDLKLISQLGNYDELVQYNKYNAIKSKLSCHMLEAGSVERNDILKSYFENSSLTVVDPLVYNDNFAVVRNSNWSNYHSGTQNSISTPPDTNLVDLFWGPYIDLPSGKYKFEISFDIFVLQKSSLYLQIFSNNPSSTIYTKEIFLDTSAKIDNCLLINEYFILDQIHGGVEIKLTLIEGQVEIYNLRRSVFVF